MDPETAFWFLSATAQAGAALAGLGVVAYVFLLGRTRDDFLALSRVEKGRRGRGAHILGFRTARPLAWATRIYLTGVALALVLLLAVQPGGPVPWGVEIGTYVALGLVLAGNVGLVAFLRDPWQIIRDQVEVSDAVKLEVRRTDTKEAGEEK